jgi:hypothetical protein
MVNATKPMWYVASLRMIKARVYLIPSAFVTRMVSTFVDDLHPRDHAAVICRNDSALESAPFSAFSEVSL